MSAARQAYLLHWTIQLKAPFLIHGNDPGRFGLDATMLIDEQRRPILPGTLLKGRIAEAWETYGAQLGGADGAEWLGRENAQRARLITSDLVLTHIGEQAFNPAADIAPEDLIEQARIKIDHDTGSVERGALLLIEQICRSGATLSFAGSWRTWATAEEIKVLVLQLEAALLLQTQLGAYRGLGFGRLESVALRAEAQPAAPVTLSNDTRQRFALQFNEPLCVNTKRERGNVFVSSDIIPGGTVLGALVQSLKARYGVNELVSISGNALATHFPQVRCTHALPVPTGGKRPTPIPQSLVEVDGSILDAALHANPPRVEKAPAFQTDWKDAAWNTASKSQGWGSTSRHLRVRTDIDEGRAKNESLFAYECVVAQTVTAKQPGTAWQFELDFTDIPESERQKVLDAVVEMLGFGLGPIGKTDAFGIVSVANASGGFQWPPAAVDINAGALLPLVLVTDALLFPTDAVADQPAPKLLEIYRAAFASLLLGDEKGCLELSHFFATQRLAGGDYLHHTFRKGHAYQAFVLTEAGSSFVFKVVHANRAAVVFARWQAHGLPLPAAVVAAYGDTWQSHPYIRQNGYGEVVLAPQHGFPALASAP